jgi:hypothetical protein
LPLRSNIAKVPSTFSAEITTTVDELDEEVRSG